MPRQHWRHVCNILHATGLYQGHPPVGILGETSCQRAACSAGTHHNEIICGQILRYWKEVNEPVEIAVEFLILLLTIGTNHLLDQIGQPQLLQLFQQAALHWSDCGQDRC